MDYSFIIVLGFLVFFLSFAVRKLEKTKKSNFTPSNYQKKNYFLTKIENEFYKKLLIYYEDKFIVIPQVNLDKLFISNYGDKSKIDRKSVDFVFLDKNDFRPILAIELDDYTHDRSDRVERDNKVNKLFEVNRFPLLRMNFNTDIKETIDSYL